MKMRWVKRSISMKGYNCNGFTFIEMLCAFSMFLIIISFIPLSISLIYQDGFVKERLQRMEWEVFLSQLKKEVRMSETVTVTSSRITLVKDNQTITYEKYGLSSIRRRVNYQGHEIMLQNIQTVQFENTSKGIQVSVIDQFNQNETAFIRPIIPMGDDHAP